MKSLRANRALLTALVLLLAFSVGAAYAQNDEVSACEGDTVTGTVVAADEFTGEVTIEQEDGTLCTVQFGSDFEHPITSMLGAYFDELNLDELQDHVESLQVEVVCDETGDCEQTDDGAEATMVRITAVIDNGDGTWTVEFVYTDEAGDTQIGSFTTEDDSLAASWEESLEVVNGEFALVTDDEGNVHLDGAGNEIGALHEDGMGFGVIVEIYAMAAEAPEACEAASSEPDEGGEGDEAGESEDSFDPCDVTVESLVAQFESGTGMGQLFQEYGRPSILGVGHVIMQEGPPNGNGEGGGTPADNACGYSRNHGDGNLAAGCQEKPGGKPPSAGTPGGPNAGNSAD